MPNEKGWLSQPEVMEMGTPVLIPDKEGNSGVWRYGSPPADGILLTKTRCEALGCSVLPSERPAAYVYNPRYRSVFRYVPFYHRNPDQITGKLTEKEAEALKKREG